MAVNPITSESLTVDFKRLMSIPVGDRVRAASVDQNFVQSILTALTPIQIAKAFPDYFRRQLPDISNFVTSNIVARNGGMFNQTGGGAGGFAYPYYDGETKPSGTVRPAGAPPPTIKEMKEKLLQRGIDVDNVYSAVKQGAVLESDERLKFLKGSSKEELEKMGLEKFQDADGKTLIRMVSVPAESLTLQQAEQKLREESSLSAGLDADSKLIKARTTKTSESLGIDQRQYNAFRQALANIESQGGEYGVIGGAGNKYSGAYQFGSAAMFDSAKALGMSVPSREEFLKNPELQEQFLDQYTALNHKTLMQVSPEYKNMTPEERLGVLGYAHNQGAGGAANWLKTGVIGSDAFGTKGTKYIDEIRNQLNETKEQVVSDPNKQYTEEEIKAYIQQLSEKQRESLIESGIRYQYGKASPTSSSYAVIDQEFKFTDKLGQITSDPRQYQDIYGKSEPGEFNYSLSPEGIQRLGLADETGRMTPASVEKNLVEIETNGGVKVKVHNSVAENTKAFLNQLEARGYPLRQADTGGYVWRTKAKSSGLSTHSTGTSLDLNWNSNWGEFGAAGNIDLPPEVEKLANYYGFSWGAKFGDPMHFEAMSPELHQKRLEQLQSEGYIEKIEKESASVTPAPAEQPAPQMILDGNIHGVNEESSVEPPAPQMALGGNIYGVNEDITLVNTKTGEPIAQVNDNERIEKQGNAIQVTPETKLKADELTQKYDTSSEIEDRMNNIENRVDQQQEIATQNIRKATAPEKVQTESPMKWREAVAAGERPVSPSFSRAMARTKFFPEGHHFNRSSPSSQS